MWLPVPRTDGCCFKPQPGRADVEAPVAGCHEPAPAGGNGSNDGDDFLQAQNSDQDTVNGGTNSDGSADFDLASIDTVDVSGLAAFVGPLAVAPALSSFSQFVSSWLF